MSDQHTIDHIGFVDSVDDRKARVRINSQSACASCHAKGACTAADQSEKSITVPVGGRSVKPGERVRVLIAKRTGLRAVAIGYVYPFFLLMIVLIILTAAGAGELSAGMWSLASLVPYYLTVFLLRNRISQAFTFRLEKLLNNV
ncbi:MAG: SoxR reducing system RseC family protein [Bacteroidales bacterium]|nr:SoxR reducing system RseC family protein [Bacteroidales bacterium]